MIFDEIGNIGSYAGISPNMAKAAAFLKDFHPTSGYGDFTVEGKNVYGFYREFDLKAPEEAKYESHRKYIDIQYLVKGEELIFCVETDRVPVETPYDEAGDYTLHGDASDAIRLEMKPGCFAIFFPQDAHKPYCSENLPAGCSKVVVKVLAE